MSDASEYTCNACYDETWRPLDEYLRHRREVHLVPDSAPLQGKRRGDTASEAFAKGEKAITSLLDALVAERELSDRLAAALEVHVAVQRTMTDRVTGDLWQAARCEVCHVAWPCPTSIATSDALNSWRAARTTKEPQ